MYLLYLVDLYFYLLLTKKIHFTTEETSLNNFLIDQTKPYIDQTS